MQNSNRKIKLTKSEKIEFSVPLNYTISQLKSHLSQLTKVPSERQKLLNLIKGKLPPDNVVISELLIENGHEFMLIGTADNEMIIQPEQSDGFLVDSRLSR